MSQDIRTSRKDWRRELLGELADTNRTAQNAVDEVDEAFAGLLGINRTDARCIDIVQRLGTVTAGQLAAESGLTTGAVTAVIDRMEHAGYLRRSRDDRDRRKVLVELTPKVRELTEETYVAFHRGTWKEIERYSDEELEAIVRFLRLERDRNLELASNIRDRAARERG